MELCKIKIHFPRYLSNNHTAAQTTGVPLPNLGPNDNPKVKHDFWLKHHDHLPNGPQKYFTMPPDFVSFLSHYGNAKILVFINFQSMFVGSEIKY